MAADAAVPGSDLLGAIFLCGLMGVIGQGIRALIGLKNAGSLTSTTPTAQTTFNASYLFLSFMIGFIAGVLAGIVLDLKNFLTFDMSNLKLLFGIIISGYAGADFVENAMSIVLPNVSTSAPPVNPPASASATVTPPVTSPVLAFRASNTLPALAPITPINTGSSALSAAMQVVCPHVNTSIWVPEIISGFEKYDLSNNRRRAAAIGQFLVEAGASFQEIIERLNYSADRACQIFPHVFPTPADAMPYIGNEEKFGNCVYANRNGNGNEKSGDGFLFRGRGLIQLTGRDEYTAFGRTVNKTAEQAATYCETKEGAALSGCWYLNSRGCLPLADSWSINEITLKVNGKAMVGAIQRAEYSTSMLKHLGG